MNRRHSAGWAGFATLGAVKQALDCQVVAVGGSPGMVRHGGTEHSSDSALSFFPKFCFSPPYMGRIPAGMHMLMQKELGGDGNMETFGQVFSNGFT